MCVARESSKLRPRCHVPLVLTPASSPARPSFVHGPSDLRRYGQLQRIRVWDVKLCKICDKWWQRDEPASENLWEVTACRQLPQAPVPKVFQLKDDRGRLLMKVETQVAVWHKRAR